MKYTIDITIAGDGLCTYYADTEIEARVLAKTITLLGRAFIRRVVIRDAKGKLLMEFA